ncbi:DUF4097 family beta strand repeat-containing protein [Streptosporangium sp. NPDC050855]|uniref:DUF4097 family beta strand repeat-containing protein n=1 Tax=Streptosporangium sp. NPDC050855 TaxID=3366194 RepID=UPI0037B3D4F1
MPTRNKLRIAWLATGGTLTALAVAFTTMAALAEINEPDRTVQVTSRSHPLTSPEVVVRATGHVDLSVVAGPAKRLDISQELVWVRDRPVVTERWDGRTLTVDARCPGVPVCRTHYVLTLPAATGVEASSRIGTVSVNGVRGDLRLSADTGDVVVTGSLGALRARVRQGDVIGDDLRSAETDAETGDGDVVLGFTAPPGDVRAVVRTRGNVEVRVPDEGGPGYNVRTDSGDATVEVRLDPDSPRRITALTPAGELRVLPF